MRSSSISGAAGGAATAAIQRMMKNLNKNPTAKEAFLNVARPITLILVLTLFILTLLSNYLLFRNHSFVNLGAYYQFISSSFAFYFFPFIIFFSLLLMILTLFSLKKRKTFISVLGMLSGAVLFVGFIVFMIFAQSLENNGGTNNWELDYSLGTPIFILTIFSTLAFILTFTYFSFEDVIKIKNSAIEEIAKDVMKGKKVLFKENVVVNRSLFDFFKMSPQQLMYVTNNEIIIFDKKLTITIPFNQIKKFYFSWVWNDLKIIQNDGKKWRFVWSGPSGFSILDNIELFGKLLPYVKKFSDKECIIMEKVGPPKMAIIVLIITSLFSIWVFGVIGVIAPLLFAAIILSLWRNEKRVNYIKWILLVVLEIISFAISYFLMNYL